MREGGCVVAIGNFDGVHKGHMSVLQTALTLARRHGLPALVLTFEPHPRTFFNPGQPVDRLTPIAAKREIFCALGFDGVVSLDFNHELAALAASDFIGQILLDGLGVRHVVTGENFYFGFKRSGNAQFLEEQGKRFGFPVHIVKIQADEAGGLISSSRIRRLLAQGELEEANHLFGHRYRICAQVVKGNQLGRTLGFPTANMRVPEQTHLKTGIYAVRLRRARPFSIGNGRQPARGSRSALAEGYAREQFKGMLHDGVASFGFRPTVNEVSEPLLETFIFDFDGNLYDEVCCVSFFARLRGEEKFDNLEEMITQMHRDTARARSILQAASPLCDLDASLNFS